MEIDAGRWTHIDAWRLMQGDGRIGEWWQHRGRRGGWDGMGCIQNENPHIGVVGTNENTQ
jgi:hypothetical protein